MSPILPAITAAKPQDFAAIREMLGEYATWLGMSAFESSLGRESDSAPMPVGVVVSNPVAAQLAREIQELPGQYQPPGGALLIARIASRPAGMVALRRLDDRRSEMKRLFVRPEGRGTGVGRQLAERVIAEARARGYREMVLDTLPVMQDAQRLYVALGFRDIAPYYDSPMPGTRYMSLDLQPAD